MLQFLRFNIVVGRWIANELERTIYAIAGLPIAICGTALAPTAEAKVIRRSFAR